MPTSASTSRRRSVHNLTSSNMALTEYPLPLSAQGDKYQRFYVAGDQFQSGGCRSGCHSHLVSGFRRHRRVDGGDAGEARCQAAPHPRYRPLPYLPVPGPAGVRLRFTPAVVRARRPSHGRPTLCRARSRRPSFAKPLPRGSGFGENSQWFANVQADPHVHVSVARHLRVPAMRLGCPKAGVRSGTRWARQRVASRRHSISPSPAGDDHPTLQQRGSVFARLGLTRCGWWEARTLPRRYRAHHRSKTSRRRDPGLALASDPRRHAVLAGRDRAPGWRALGCFDGCSARAGRSRHETLICPELDG